jgi:hypothetical protein
MLFCSAFFFHPAKELLIANTFIQISPGQQFFSSEKLTSFSVFSFFISKIYTEMMVENMGNQ